MIRGGCIITATSEPGTSSTGAEYPPAEGMGNGDSPEAAERAALPFDPPAARPCLRLTTVWSTSAVCAVSQLQQIARPASYYLRLGRLAPFYLASDGQLPAVIARHELDPTAVSFTRWSGTVAAARVWLFASASGHVVAALTLDVDADPMGSIPLLEDLYYADIAVSGTSLPRVLADVAPGPIQPPDLELMPERHQLVFATATGSMPDDDTLQRMVYRADLPMRDGASSIRFPAELNRRPTTRGALGPYVSVLVGLQDYVENAALLSAVLVVAASSRLRQIRDAAYRGVADLRASTDHAVPTRERRLALEDMANTLRTLELDLSYSVEAVADLGMLIPALRVESYHEALIDSMSLDRRAATTGRMLERLANAIDAELTSVQSVEARADDARRVRTVAAVTFVTTIAGMISLLFAFLGINAREVDPARSMFDHHYLAIYLTVAGIALGGGLIFTGLVLAERHRRT